ncbi:Txe/YoeB family addiction module toxin [Endozoicomonas acroporae]|uniref:Txe/YoeB family addiction module toxin n=1 Tax=Endozoicomonas acroporae TaxID=1701104 RepID=UPI000C779E69|nr:Txe/YoeB family addiction module toxin [Endozoicomonas acroporae]
MSTPKKVTLSWSEEAWEDCQYWLATDKPKAGKLRKLIKECLRSPFEGTGKPEPLKGNFSGFWSRRIDQEHRLVYAFSNGNLFILQCRFHY